MMRNSVERPFVPSIPVVRRSVSSLVCALFLGCSERTQLVVAIDSDLDVPEVLDSLVLRVRPLGGIEESRQPLSVAEEGALPRPGRYSLPLSFGVSPPGDDPQSEVDLRVDVLDASGSVKLTTRAVTGFIRERSLLLPLFIPRSCLGFECGEEQTCRVGGCTSVRVDPLGLEEATPEEDLNLAFAAIDAGVLDASAVDAGRLDAMDPDAETGADARPTDGPFDLRDTGVPSDTGVAQPDAGGAQPDTGVAQADAGANPADTGEAPVDTGVVQHADTGIPEDSGVQDALVLDAGELDATTLDAGASDAAAPDSGDPCAGPEICDGLDNNCNLDVDEGGVCSGWVEHCGTLGNQVWSGFGPHRVTCPVLIPSGVTLEIQAGALVKFERTAQLQVDGLVRVVGTQASPVRIMPNVTRGPQNGGQPWNGITGAGRLESEHAIWMWGSSNVQGSIQLLDSYFEDFQIDGTVDSRVSRCQLVRTGLNIRAKSKFEPAVIEDCSIQGSVAIAPPGVVRGNVFLSESGLEIGSGEDVSVFVFENRFLSSSGTAVTISGTTTLRRNDFSNANPLHISAARSAGLVDARGNYFGSVTQAQIQAGTQDLSKIQDSHDDFSLGTVDVAEPLSLPFGQVPLAADMCGPISTVPRASAVYAQGYRDVHAIVEHEGLFHALAREGSSFSESHLVSVSTSTSSDLGPPADIEWGVRFDPKLTLSANGTLVAVFGYEQDGGLAFSRATAGPELVWSIPQLLDLETYSDGQWEGTPSIATDGAGSWVIVFSEQWGTPGPIRILRSIDDGITWTGRWLGVSGTDPTVAADESGHWVVVYGGQNGADMDLFALTSSTSGATFASNRVINPQSALDDSPVGVDDDLPLLSYHPVGGWLLAWRSAGRLMTMLSPDAGATWATQSLASTAAGMPSTLHYDGRRWMMSADYENSSRGSWLTSSEDGVRWQTPTALAIATNRLNVGIPAAFGIGEYGGIAYWLEVPQPANSPQYLRSAAVLPCTP